MPDNILVIMSDDHARWATGCYGNADLRTPTLDHLATTGVRMANAFTPSPVCSPARACFWTGRLPSQHGVHDFLAEQDPDVAEIPWLAHETTLAQLLQRDGFVTGLSGKWHLGNPGTVPDGFDFWFSQSFPVARPHGFHSPWGEVGCDSPAYNRHLITDRAIEFLRGRPHGRPFFLFVGYIATHSPWSGHPERLVDSYRSCRFDDIPSDITYPFGRPFGEALFATRQNPKETLAQYYAAVSEIDEQVGRLVDELDAQAERARTLVIYTSDHGLAMGHHGLWGKGNATRPYNMLDETIRVPLIVNQPGAVLGGQTRMEPVNHCDLFMTLLEHAGTEVPDERSVVTPYPGRSFRDLCLGKPLANWPHEMYGEYGNLRMVRTPQHKLVRRYPDGPCELYDLAADPRETTNLFDCPAQADLLDRLTSEIDDYFGRYEAPGRSGLGVATLPRHNAVEAWRDAGEHHLVAEPTWLRDIENLTGGADV
ncbi:MAG: sulfatase-like hydrolase/transferase [Actinomycetes bacterium]